MDLAWSSTTLSSKNLPYAYQIDLADCLVMSIHEQSKDGYIFPAIGWGGSWAATRNPWYIPTFRLVGWKTIPWQEWIEVSMETSPIFFWGGGFQDDAKNVAGHCYCNRSFPYNQLVVLSWWFGARWFGFVGSPYQRDWDSNWGTMIHRAPKHQPPQVYHQFTTSD